MARVLVVYANPITSPSPVPPLGAQRVRAVLEGAGCEARLVCPWLDMDPTGDLERALDWQPDLVALSVRNVDDSLVVRSADGEGDIETRYCLPEVGAAVERVRARGIPLLAGGTAISCGPVGVLRALGVRWGVVGPAEDVCWRLGRALAAGVPFPEALPADARVVDSRGAGPGASDLRIAGERWSPPLGPSPLSSAWLALLRERGGRVPVFFGAGCDRRCRFCVEPSFLGGRSVPRGAAQALAEIEAVFERTGLTRFFLAGSEANVPDASAFTALMRGLAARGLHVDVRAFLLPAPVDGEMLDSMEAAGHDPQEFSFEFGHFDDLMLRRGAGPASRRQIDRLVSLWLDRGYRTLGGSALLGGHPEETWRSIDSAIEAIRGFDAALPDGFGLAWSPGARVYPASALGRWVQAHPDEAAPDLYGCPTKELIEPVAFCRPAPPRELFGYVQERLAGGKGAVRPMNAELRAEPGELEAERRVNAAIVAREAGGTARARELLEDALAHAPAHAEALRQLALVLANDLGESEKARSVLVRLRAAVQGSPARVAEVEAALRGLE